MQLFVRGLSGRTSAVSVEDGQLVRDIKRRMQEVEGLPVGAQVLLSEGRQLADECAASSLEAGSTLHVTSRLLGGKPVKVKIITNHLPCGNEVTIDIEADASKDDIKAKLADLTGVPVEHQKIMLSGINQICMGDKRTNITYASCGSANGVQMAVPAK